MWEIAREKYETTKCTQTALAKEMGVSRQAVQKRAIRAGWIKYVPLPVEVVNDLECVKPVAGSRLGLRTEENIAVMVDTFALTGNKAMACRQIGINESTLTNWCAKDKKLSVLMLAMREAHLIGQYRKIANAPDWKAAKEILSRAPETKEQWGENREKGPTFVLNIVRDEVVIPQS